jgi:cytochrome c556
MLVRAQALDVLGRLVAESYPPGSDQGSTKAKPDIWKNSQRFRQLATESQSETARLKVAVETGDLEAIKGAYRATGQSCKACHDQFKAK